MSLWDTPVSDKPFFTPEEEEEKLAKALNELTPERIKRMQEDPEFQEKLRKRLAPYRTKVDWARLMNTWLP